MSTEPQLTSMDDASLPVPPTVVHLLPYDQARGAQRYARTLVDRIGSEEQRHLILTLFEGEGGSLDADIALDIRRGFWRRFGLDPRAVVGLRRIFRDMKPELVVAHGGEPAKYAAMALGKSTPLVYVSIGSAHPGLSRRRSSLLRSRYLRRADSIVSVSMALARELELIEGVPSDKIVVIPNGRDPSTYRPSDSGEMSQATRLVWIGQLDVAKRPEVFIELVEALTGVGIQVEGTIVGEGPRKDDLSALAGRAGVSMLGARDDIPGLLAASDLLVFTGKPPEGMPGVLIEAGMSGLAVVSTRVPGADEVISDGETGILVDVDDREALVAAVRRLVEDVDGRRAMGRNARARCVELFSIDRTLSLWRDLFARLLTA